jgi:hypothetical protein
MIGNPSNIILGNGIFNVNGVDIGLTRGGGKFVVKTTYKLMEADGDLGPVKGRQVKTKSVATLDISALELLTSNLPKLYAAMALNTSDPTKDVLTAAADIVDADYSTIYFLGKTKAGKAVKIILNNAINLEGLDWTLKDKDEIVPKLTFTATYDETTPTTEPWSIEFAKVVANDLTAPNGKLSAPAAGAKTQLIFTFNEVLNATTLAITDINNLLFSLSNDALGTPVAIAITSVANSVTWLDTLTANPKAVITIPSTTFVAGKTVRLNFKAAAVKDTATTPNVALAATNFDAIVTA